MLDSGLLHGATAQHSWLAGVTGEYEDPRTAARPDPALRRPRDLRGRVRHHGPQGQHLGGQDVYADRREIRIRTRHDVNAALGGAWRSSSLAFGTNTRKDVPSLGFEAWVSSWRTTRTSCWWRRPATTTSNRRSGRPPSAGRCRWARSPTDWRSRADFSNYGPWVDVYAPGERLVNAFASGQYECQSPPNIGQLAEFPRHGPLERNFVRDPAGERASSRPACQAPARPPPRRRRPCAPWPGPRPAPAWDPCSCPGRLRRPR